MNDLELLVAELESAFEEQGWRIGWNGIVMDLFTTVFHQGASIGQICVTESVDSLIGSQLLVKGKWWSRNRPIRRDLWSLRIQDHIDFFKGRYD